MENPLFKTIDEWYPEETDDGSWISTAHYERFPKCWDFLRPFFASRGYILYEYGPQRWNNYPPEQDIAPSEDTYPYGRRLCKDRERLKFTTPPCLRLWAARDVFGRDVVIKLVAESELDILKYLNSEEARSNPRNHTIPLIDFGTVHGFSFSITPRQVLITDRTLREALLITAGFDTRWDVAFCFNFKTVSEAMHMAKILLEGMDFLHETRVFHADFLEQNIGMNVVLCLDRGVKQPPGLRDPPVTRYAFYDFENSARYPIEMPLEDILETKYAGFHLRGIKDPKGPYKPFPLDVLGLGMVLERRTRHFVNIVPELGPFLDGMVTLNEAERYTAHDALEAFNKIYSSLNSDQLSHVLRTSMWSRKCGITSIDPNGI